MITLQKSGGIAALIQALAYIAGFAVLATVLNPGDTAGWSSAQKLGFMLERQALFQYWSIGIYVVFGIALVVLAVALHERLKPGAPALMAVATAFALIWAGLVIASGMVASVGLEAVGKLHATDVAQAVAAWSAIAAVQDGLGGGVEVVGGLWVGLVSWAALVSRSLPRWLSVLGLAVGAAGLVTLVPALGAAGAAFGLGQIVWFAWLGVHLLLCRCPTP